MGYCIIMTTFASAEQAEPIVSALLERRLAACIQRIAISSSYVWEGKVQNDPELLILIKTRDELFREVKETIEKLHPYDTPEVVKVPIDAGSASYLAWIDEVTG